MKEEFEDNIEVIRIRKIKEGHTTQWSKEKRIKGQTTIYNTLHINNWTPSSKSHNKHIVIEGGGVCILSLKIPQE